MLNMIRVVGPILVGLFAAFSIVIGAYVALRSTAYTKTNSQLTRVFAFGTGAFFAAVCLDFLPDAWAGGGDKTPDWVFLGALVMWVATHVSDGLFMSELSASSTTPNASNLEGEMTNESSGDISLRFTRVSAIVLAGALSFHTFFEGAATSFSFHDPNITTLGFALAVILHKLPEGVLWGFALATVFPGDPSKIRTILTIPAICTLIGVFLGIDLANRASSQVLHIAVGLVAGAMLYIAFAELLPALRESTQPRLTRTWFVIGLVVMFVLNTGSNLFG